MTDLPPGIGPHEGIEFDLMRRGEKHVAYFLELEPAGLPEILNDGFHLIQWCWRQEEALTILAWIVYRTGFEDAALRLKELVTLDHHGFDPETEHEIGQILSYSRSQVDAFLAHVNKRS